MRVLVGGLIVGVILLFPSERPALTCLVAGLLTAWLAVLAGPRSHVERVGLVLLVGAIAWVGGPRAAGRGQSLLEHFLAWGAAGSALSYYLRPRAQ